MALQHWFHFALVAAWLGDDLRRTLTFNKRALKVLKITKLLLGQMCLYIISKLYFSFLYFSFYGPFSSLMSEKSCQVSVVTAYIYKLGQSAMMLPDDAFMVR